MATKKYVSLEKLSLYDDKIKKVITDGDAAALQAAKDYADESFELANENAASLANTAEANAKAYADGKDTAIQAAADAAAAAATAAATADGKAVAAQGAVDALAGYVGTIPEGATATNVVAYVQEKTAGIASEGAMNELGNRVTAVEGDVATIKGDYLKAADKTELAGDIADVQTAVDTEKGRAEGVEAGLDARLAVVEGDYLKAADKTELQGNIDTVAGAVERLTNGVSADEVDGVNDLIQYVKDHGTEVTGMQGNIAQNASDIAGVAGRMTTAEGKITAVEGAVATKVEQTAYDAKVAELAGADTALSGRIATLEAAVGESGSVAEDIATAKQEAIDAAAAAADTKDEAVLAAAKKYADDEDAKIETRVDALEADTHTHGNKALLDTYTQTEANLADAVAKKHEHANKAELDLIASGDKAKWDAAEGNAKSYTDTEVGKDRARLDAVEAWQTNFIECSEEDIAGLFTA